MRAHVHAAARGEIDRTEVIEEHERPDLPAQALRQQPAHDESVAEIVKARFDDERCGGGHAWTLPI
jgi:hypothetical protein